MTVLASFLVLLFAYSLVSKRAEQTVLTAPIVFTTAGFVAPIAIRALHGGPERNGAFLTVAELGLVLLLFTDASRTDLRLLRSIRSLPSRLLGVGMPLTIALGALGALGILRGLTLWEAGILAAILAPTDAGLGQVIVTSPRVPARISQALNVEAGLNDGLSVPFMLFFIALAVAGGRAPEARLGRFVFEQLGYGVAIGAGIGLAGGGLLGRAQRAGTMAGPFLQVGVVALPLLCAAASEAVGASMFIAAFVAGLAVQVPFEDAGAHAVEFTEQWGQLINLFIFFLFGMIVDTSRNGFTSAMVLYAVASLTVVRMLPVALSLLGTGLSRASVAFMGWFGPRGLASIVLGLVYLEREAHLPGEATIVSTVEVTVLMSVFAHGLTALPGIARYGRRVASLPELAPERRET